MFLIVWTILIIIIIIIHHRQVVVECHHQKVENWKWNGAKEVVKVVEIVINWYVEGVCEKVWKTKERNVL